MQALELGLAIEGGIAGDHPRIDIGRQRRAGRRAALRWLVGLWHRPESRAAWHDRTLRPAGVADGRRARRPRRGEPGRDHARWRRSTQGAAAPPGTSIL